MGTKFVARVAAVSAATIVAIGGTLVVAAPASAATVREQIVSVARGEVNGRGCDPGYYNSCGIEWCSEFARWVWAHAGVPDVDGLDGWAQSFKDYGQDRGTYHSRASGYTPQPGDAIVFDWDHSSSDGHPIDHVAIVTSASSTTVYTIGGNQGNSDNRLSVVSDKASYSRTDGDIDGYVEPAGADSSAHDSSRIGVVHTAGQAYVKEGSLSASWTLLASATKQIVVSGNRIGVIDANDDVYIKEGPVNAGWVKIADAVTRLDMSGNRIGVVHTNGDLYIKEGTLSAPWAKVADAVTQFDLEGNRIGVVHTNADLYIKEGTLSAAWAKVADAVTQVAMSGNRIGVVHTGGQVYVKEGSLSAAWAHEADGCSQMDLDGTRIGVVHTDGSVYVKEGSLGAAWAHVTDGSLQVDLSGDRIGVVRIAGQVHVKEGSLGAAWVHITDGSTQISLG